MIVTMPKKKTSFRFDDKLLQSLADTAKKLDRSMNWIVETAIQEFVNREQVKDQEPKHGGQREGAGKRIKDADILRRISNGESVKQCEIVLLAHRLKIDTEEIQAWQKASNKERAKDNVKSD